MKVVKWITGASRSRGKSLIPSTIITMAIVAMLILSGPAQAVSVMIVGLEKEYTQGSDVDFQVKIDLNENDKYVPLTNISLDLTGNDNIRAVFDLNGKKISGNCNIEMKPVSVPNPNDFGYGSGYGYDAGTGYGYEFGNGYGYGYGYGGGGGKISFIYNVSIETDCLSAGEYTVVATLNTDRNIAFQSSPFKFELKPGNKLNADVEIKPETLNRASKGTFTAFITSEEFDVNEIIGNTIHVTCDGCNSAHAVKWNTADKKFIAKFKTQDLNVKKGDSVVFVVTGKLKNGDVFEGSDTIKVIESGKIEEDDEDDDECECDDDENVKEHDDECGDDQVKEHDNDEDVKDHQDDEDEKEHDDDKNVNVNKPEKNKDDNKKNLNNGGKGKNVIIINDNKGTVNININDRGSDTTVEPGNSNNRGNGNKGGKNRD